jgi:integrase
MPAATVIQRRDRALVAFTMLTGMRDNAIASLRLKHIHLEREFVIQDPGQGVRTKFSKKIITFFFPLGADLKQVVIDWVRELRCDLLYGNDDPVSPARELPRTRRSPSRLTG